MAVYTIEQAQERLEELIDQAVNGGKVIIRAEDGQLCGLVPVIDPDESGISKQVD